MYSKNQNGVIFSSKFELGNPRSSNGVSSACNEAISHDSAGSLNSTSWNISSKLISFVSLQKEPAAEAKPEANSCVGGGGGNNGEDACSAPSSSDSDNDSELPPSADVRAKHHLPVVGVRVKVCCCSFSPHARSSFFLFPPLFTFST